MKVKYLVFSVLTVLNFVTAFGQKNKPFINPTPGEITIMAIDPAPEGIDPTKETYKEIVDCGFNLVSKMNNLNYFKKQFKLMGDLDLKYMVSSPSLRNAEMKEMVKTLKDDKHLGGWLFIDEPQYEQINNLAVLYENLYKTDPDNFIYMNLVGQMVKKFTGPYKDYASYLNFIQNKFYPGVWSFDLYPIYRENGKLNVMYDMFYGDLEAMKNISTKTVRPFWSFCLGMAYKVGKREFPAATVPFLRFEAFSALAYGAQGIVYWTYGQRKSNNEKYLSALVNLDGKKTPAWNAAKQVNGEIKKYNEVFYECKVKDVRHTGSKLYKGTKKIGATFGPFKSVKSGNAGVLISDIVNKGKEYIVIVNHDISNTQKVTLQLQPGKKVSELTSNMESVFDAQKSFSVTLDKGGYVIFKVVE